MLVLGLIVAEWVHDQALIVTHVLVQLLLELFLRLLVVVNHAIRMLAHVRLLL